MPAIPLVSGRDVGSPVRVKIGDNDSSNYEFSDSDLIYLLGNAIDTYNRLNPYKLSTTITRVSGQRDYVLPTDVIQIYWHNYRRFPGIDTSTIITYFNMGSWEIVPFTDWSDKVISKIRNEFTWRFDNIGAGSAEQIDYMTSYSIRQFIRVYPTPVTSGDTFDVYYQARHPIQNGNYFTIPFTHALHIQKLLEAEVYSARLASMSASPDTFAAGTTRIQFGKSVDKLESRAIALREQVFEALSSPIGARK